METKLNEPGDGKKCPIAIMVRDGKVLLGHRHYTAETWKKISVWTMPGGRSEPGETLFGTLKREAFEEVGITEFEVVDFIGEVPGAKEGDTVVIFLCITKQDFKLMEPEKFSEWRWVDIKDYIAGGEYSGFNQAARDLISERLLKISA